MITNKSEHDNPCGEMNDIPYILEYENDLQLFEPAFKTAAKEYFPEFLDKSSCDENECDIQNCFSQTPPNSINEVNERLLAEHAFVDAIIEPINLFDEPIKPYYADSHETRAASGYPGNFVTECQNPKKESNQLTENSSCLADNSNYLTKNCSPHMEVGQIVPTRDAKGISELTADPIAVPALNLYGKAYDVYAIRKDFPILEEKVHGKPLVWFDNAATTQKPKQVIERIKYFYEHENSNVHRAAHKLAARTTDAYEGARSKISSFLNASSPDQIVFVKGATEGINLVASSFGIPNLSEGDEVIVTLLEHHANIVPWQMACLKTGAKLRAAPVDEKGQVILAEFERLLSPKTKIVALTHISNVLGTVTPVEDVINMAHRVGARVLVDGAQAAAHKKIDVQQLDCDFYVFSGHKVLGPTGIGVLYGKSELLELMSPYQGGGNMISDVTLEKTVYKFPPHRFEAGTGNIADAIGLGSAIDYIQGIGLDSVSQYETMLLQHAREAVRQVPGINLLGKAKVTASILSFTVKGHSPDEIGKALDKEGIAVRTGHHCSQPILRRFGLESAVRASFALYNTIEEIDYFVSVLRNIAVSRSFY